MGFFRESRERILEGEFSRNLIKKGGIIAEFKRSSPTRNFHLKFTPEEMAWKYERAGASAISVVVDEVHFKTTYDDLYRIRKAAKLPILCKGFIKTDDRIRKAKDNGADAILLIARILSRERLFSLMEKSEKSGLEAVVEIHTEEDLEKIKDIPVKILGINNRDLVTLKVDLNHGERILEMAKRKGMGKLRIIESGIKFCSEIRRFKKMGADAFLIGSSLLASSNIEAKLREFVKAVQQ